MLRDFFLGRHLPFSALESIQETLQDWTIEVIAVAHLAPNDLTDQDKADFATRETVLFLFKVPQAIDLENAGTNLDTMLVEARDAAYDKRLISFIKE